MLNKYIVNGFECWLKPETADALRTGKYWFNFSNEDERMEYVLCELAEEYAETGDDQTLEAYVNVFKSLNGCKPGRVYHSGWLSRVRCAVVEC